MTSQCPSGTQECPNVSHVNNSVNKLATSNNDHFQLHTIVCVEIVFISECLTYLSYYTVWLRLPFSCLISNTMPQLEQSSLQPSTYLQHRHLLQTTSYNHLLRLHLLISRKGKPKQQQARTPPPPPGGLRSQKGLRPFNPLQRIGFPFPFPQISITPPNILLIGNKSEIYVLQISRSKYKSLMILFLRKLLYAIENGHYYLLPIY